MLANGDVVATRYDRYHFVTFVKLLLYRRKSRIFHHLVISTTIMQFKSRVVDSDVFYPPGRSSRTKINLLFTYYVPRPKKKKLILWSAKFFCRRKNDCRTDWIFNTQVSIKPCESILFCRSILILWSANISLRKKFGHKVIYDCMSLL